MAISLHKMYVFTVPMREKLVEMLSKPIYQVVSLLNEKVVFIRVKEVQYADSTFIC